MTAGQDTRTRARVLAAIVAYPGLHVRELARQLETSVALVEYHLKALSKEGSIDLRADRRFVRVFPAKGRGRVAESDRAAVQALRSGTGLSLVLRILAIQGPVSHGALAASSGLAKSTLSFHLKRLVAVGLLLQQDDGYEVADARRVLDLLQRYRPTPDLLDRFADLWSALYGP